MERLIQMNSHWLGWKAPVAMTQDQIMSWPTMDQCVVGEVNNNIGLQLPYCTGRMCTSHSALPSRQAGNAWWYAWP